MSNATMPPTGQFWLRGVRWCKGNEGPAWSATLMQASNPVAEVRDSGNGGMLRIRSTASLGWDGPPAALLNHVAALSPEMPNNEDSRTLWPNGRAWDAESFVSALFWEWLKSARHTDRA